MTGDMTSLEQMPTIYKGLLEGAARKASGGYPWGYELAMGVLQKGVQEKGNEYNLIVDALYAWLMNRDEMR